MTLKPNTSYRFSKEDYDFALELSKVGDMHILSSQVTLKSVRAIEFKEYGDDGVEGLILPQNWVIEGIYQSEDIVQITFGIKD